MWTLLSVSNITKLVCVYCISCITDRCWWCLEVYYNATHCIKWVFENTAKVVEFFFTNLWEPLVWHWSLTTEQLDLCENVQCYWLTDALHAMFTQKVSNNLMWAKSNQTVRDGQIYLKCISFCCSRQLFLFFCMFITRPLAARNQ